MIIFAQILIEFEMGFGTLWFNDTVQAGLNYYLILTRSSCCTLVIIAILHYCFTATFLKLVERFKLIKA